MKNLNRTFAAFTALGFTLVSATVWALRPALRLDAATEEGKVTQLTAQILEQAHFAHQRLDDNMAAKFLDRYLDMLDGSNELFLQSDVGEFHGMVPGLAQATRNTGDVHPAHLIFQRYLQRIGERATYVTKALADEKFDFTGHDRFFYDREKAPRPQDETEARNLWLQRLRADVLQEKLAGKKPEQFAQTLTHRYQRQVLTMKKLSNDAVLELYLNALAHVYDPHSDYMGHEQLASFNIVMNLSLAGIGASLHADDGICKIFELVPGGPALRSGKLKNGDRIVAVSQGAGKETVDLVDLPLPQAVDLIRGPKGTDVTLTIIPVGASEDVRKTVTITRDEIHFDEQKAKARIVDFPVKDGKAMRLGVIDLPAFYASEQGKGESATADVRRLLRKLDGEKVHGIILDLRRNGGGSLEEAIHLTGLFIKSGPVVQTKDLAGNIQVGTDDDDLALYTGPLIVLTSRFSASASEIVAGALQDYGRALIVGDTSTFGKGTVQTMIPMGTIMQRSGIIPDCDPGALKVTISKFYRPGGSSTQLRGVQSDIVLPSFTDLPEIGESAMKNPFAWDAVPAARYQDLGQVKPYVDRLRGLSSARITSHRDFSLWNQDIELMKKFRAEKSISLNEAGRRKERDDTKARTKAHDAERLASKVPAPVTYEITVKNATEPGLPKALDLTKPALTKVAADDEEVDDAAPAVPAQDLLLSETEHILTNYVELAGASDGPFVTQR